MDFICRCMVLDPCRTVCSPVVFDYLTEEQCMYNKSVRLFEKTHTRLYGIGSYQKVCPHWQH